MFWYITFTTIVAILSGLIVWDTQSRLKFPVIITFIVILGLFPIVYFNTLSKPKDLDDEWLRSDKEVGVISYYAKPGVALYLWLQLDDIQEPRYYKLPWGEEAQKLTQKLQDLKRGNQQAVLNNPFFEKSLERDRRMIHPLPQPALPPKEPEEEVPTIRWD